MAQFCKIDPDGLFVEDYIGEQPVTADVTPDPAYIAMPVPPDAGFILPRWNGETKAWEEGGTPPEPVTPEPTREERLAAVEAAVLDMILGGAVSG